MYLLQPVEDMEQVDVSRRTCSPWRGPLLEQVLLARTLVPEGHAVLELRPAGSSATASSRAQSGPG